MNPFFSVGGPVYIAWYVDDLSHLPRRFGLFVIRDWTAAAAAVVRYS